MKYRLKKLCFFVYESLKRDIEKNTMKEKNIK